MYELTPIQLKFLIWVLVESKDIKLSTKCRTLFSSILLNNIYMKEDREELTAYTEQILNVPELKWRWNAYVIGSSTTIPK